MDNNVNFLLPLLICLFIYLLVSQQLLTGMTPRFTLIVTKGTSPLIQRVEQNSSYVVTQIVGVQVSIYTETKVALNVLIAENANCSSESGICDGHSPFRQTHGEASYQPRYAHNSTGSRDVCHFIIVNA